MIIILKKIALSVLVYLFGTVILIILISLIIQPELLPDGTSVLPEWTIFVLIIYWILMFLIIWKNSFTKLKSKIFGLKNEFKINSDIDDYSQNGLSLDQISLVDKIDPLLYEVANYIIETGRASTSNIQRRFGLGYNRAAHFIDILELCGIIGKSKNSLPRPILSKDISLLKNYTSKELLVEDQDDSNNRLKLIIQDPVLFSNDNQFYKILEFVIKNRNFNVDEVQSLFDLSFGVTANYIQTLKLLQVLDDNTNFILSESESFESITDYIKYAYLSNADYVSSMNLDMIKNGLEFESFIGSLLTKNNYHDVVVTQASNDYGIDVTATKEGIKYAIQCKYYTSPVGNTSIQEVVAGKHHYGAHVAVVATNTTFTKNATELARSNNVILWDRSEIIKLIDKARTL